MESWGSLMLPSCQLSTVNIKVNDIYLAKERRQDFIFIKFQFLLHREIIESHKTV